MAMAPLLSALIVSGCGGSPSPTDRRLERHVVTAGVALTAVPSSARALCLRGWLLRPACPSLVPTVAPDAMRPQVGAGCSGGATMNSVPLTSHQCRFAQWSYLAFGEAPAGTRGKNVLWTSLPPPPPYFVHVLIYAADSRSDLPFALPNGPPRHLSDALLATSHPTRAILLEDARWGGRDGQLILAPSYPGGGEVGSHLVFSYRTGRAYHGISIHPWLPDLNFRVLRGARGGTVQRVQLAPDPSYPWIVSTLKAIVSSAK